MSNCFTMIVPTGPTHAPLLPSDIDWPSGRPIQRRLSAPSDHSGATMSYGTRPACGMGRFAVDRSKQPVCERFVGGAVTGKPQPLIDARDERPRLALRG